MPLKGRHIKGVWGRSHQQARLKEPVASVATLAMLAILRFAPSVL